MNAFVPENGVIVDIGCGREAAFLKQNRQRIQKGYGFDFRIQNAIFDNLELFHHQPDAPLHLKTESADAVFLNAVLEHIPQPHFILEECKRILKKNGHLVMTTPTPKSQPVLEFLAFRLHIINEDEIREHCHYYHHEDIVQLAHHLKMNLKHYALFQFGFNSLMILEKKSD